LGDIVDHLRQGHPLPPRCAAITVDDAYHSFLSGAMPLLRRYGYPATLFVNTDSVGGREFLSWDELRTLAAEGIEIGNHSASHLYLLDRAQNESVEMWRERIGKDLSRAREALNRELGEQERLLAYPYGEYSAEVAELVRDLGFSGAAAQHSGVISSATDLFALPRFPMGGIYVALSQFREKLAMKALEVRVIEPSDPLASENPPLMVVDILSRNVDLSRLRCFVPGQSECPVQADAAVTGRYHVRAQQPLSGRRSKYTLTAPGQQEGWFWFSQLWIYPQR
jgi:peptidoglycan/xylan/chitin deacetylase (PgdA/CDA1 family)